jgi:hypothetical protein
VAVVALTLSLTACMVQAAQAQEPGEQAVGRGRFAGMQRVGGTVTAVSGANVAIKGEDGATYQVVTTDNTRLMRGRGVTIKLSDLKPGDGVMAMGNLDAPNKTMHAAMVMAIDAEEMKKIEDARKEYAANIGKTLIAGRVTAIDLDNATMTVERPDGVSQTIGFDENTSFRRGRINMGEGGSGMRAGGNASANGGDAETGESITLADIKVGDRVGGPGALKNGKFISKELTVMTPGAGRRRDAEQPTNGGGSSTQPNAQPHM